MIGRPEYTLTLPPPCPTNRDHLSGLRPSSLFRVLLEPLPCHALRLGHLR